jgi:hypothetical protein
MPWPLAPKSLSPLVPQSLDSLAPKLSLPLHYFRLQDFSDEAPITCLYP